MSLVQITQIRGEVRGPVTWTDPPNGLIELQLEDHQRVVQVDWHRHVQFARRATVDWTWTASAWRHPQLGEYEAASGAYSPPRGADRIWRLDGRPGELCAGWAAIGGRA